MKSQCDICQRKPGDSYDGGVVEAIMGRQGQHLCDYCILQIRGYYAASWAGLVIWSAGEEEHFAQWMF
jgi:hypothetical protein